MSGVSEHDLRYPIGKIKIEGEITPEMRKNFIHELEETPSKLRDAVKGLNEDQLNTPYRPNGWTVRQVVHHLADSHLNCYMRFKLALTENEPTIKPYKEDKWAELSDTFNTPISVSIDLLESLHTRWTNLIKSFSEEDFKRTYVHPENGLSTLERALAIYSWHGKHHVAHITSLRKRMGW